MSWCRFNKSWNSYDKKHLEAHNLSSDLKQIDAEKLPFNDNSFDVVYFRVIHYSKHPDRIISEIHRVLKEWYLLA